MILLLTLFHILASCLDIFCNFTIRSSIFLPLDESIPSKSKPTSPFCQAVDVIGRLMKEKDYRLCDGMICKRPKDAKFTYVQCSTVREFLMKSLANPKVADVLAHQIDRICNLLSDPSCRLIKPIRKATNIIEVLPPSTCFLIAEKRFVKLKKLNRDLTPRAFVRYHYDKAKVPLPRPFVEGINFLIITKVRISKKNCKLIFHFLFIRYLQQFP